MINFRLLLYKTDFLCYNTLMIKMRVLFLYKRVLAFCVRMEI